MNFEENLLPSTRYSPKLLSWVDWLGNSVGVSTGVTATEFSRKDIDLVIRGDKLGDPAMLRFRDPAFVLVRFMNIMASGKKLLVIVHPRNNYEH